MRRKLALVFSAILICSLSWAEDEFTAEYLDTVKIKKAKVINDYMTIGVNYGVTLSNMYFNPLVEQEWMFSPNYVSVMFTKYCKMFGYMPYFGLEVGISYGKQGFRTRQNPESEYVTVVQFGTIGKVANIMEEKMTVVKVPMRAKFHADLYPFRFQANVGFYTGYRLDVERIAYGTPPDPSILNTFQSYEYRFDYGMEGGLGFALLFDPIEIHVGALMGWSWNSIYAPDSRPTETAKYYYRYAYPLDLMISAGVHFQLTKRSGKTSGELRKKAYEEVYKDVIEAKAAAKKAAEEAEAKKAAEKDDARQSPEGADNKSEAVISEDTTKPDIDGKGKSSDRKGMHRR